MKRWNLILILSIVLTGGLVADAFAMIYYVNGATGVNDSAHGSTAAKPFKTIQYALAKPNATEIRIAKGTYTGPFTIPEYRKITLKGAGIEKTFLNGDRASPVVSADGPTKVTLTALTIQNGTNGIWGRMAYLTGSKIRVWNNTSHGIYAKGNSYLSLEDSTVSCQWRPRGEGPQQLFGRYRALHRHFQCLIRESMWPTVPTGTLRPAPLHRIPSPGCRSTGVRVPIS